MEEIISKKSVLKIIQQVRDTILKKQLIECSTTIIISISGGQDSVFLLFCLSFLQFQINFIFKMVWCNHFWQIDSFYTTLHLTMCAINFASPLITFLPLHAFAVDLTHIPLRAQKLDCVFSCSEDFTKNKTRYEHSLTSKVCAKFNAQPIFLQIEKVARSYTFTGSYFSGIFLPMQHKSKICEVHAMLLLRRSTPLFAPIAVLVPLRGKKLHLLALLVPLLAPKGHSNRSKKGHCMHFTNLRFVLHGNYTEGVWNTGAASYRKYDRLPFFPFGHKIDAVFLRNNLSVLRTTCQQKGNFYTNQVRLFSLNFVKTRPKSFDFGLSKKLDFTLLKLQKPAVFNCSPSFTGAHTCFFLPCSCSERARPFLPRRGTAAGARRGIACTAHQIFDLCCTAIRAKRSTCKYALLCCFESRRRVGHRFHTSAMHHPLDDQPLKMMHHTEGVHNIFRQIFQAKFVPVRRQLLIRQVKIFLSIYQITEFNSFLTFAKTKINLFNLCKVHRGLILTAFFTYINKSNLIKLFCRWSSYPRIIDASCLFTPKTCGARAQSSFAMPLQGKIDKKTITISETKARNWRHITTQRSSTFYTSEKAIYGHTLSDRVETIIFNLIRGSGNTGVKSLPWKRKLSTFSYNKFYLSLQQVVKNTHLLLEL